MDSGLVAQFTEDPSATEPTVCERVHCKAQIAAGEPRHYIGGYNSQRGKVICGKCIEYYAAQPTTISSTIFSVWESYFDSRPLEKDFERISRSDAQDVRRDVIEARKKGEKLS